MDDTKKIPAILFPYRHYAAISRSLESISACSDRLSLYVVESPSDRTASLIRPYMTSAVDRGVVEKYVVFDENISNNGLQIALSLLRPDVERSEYVILSDLDLLVPHGLIEEQVAIMSAHDDLFACGMQVDYSSWGADFADLAIHHQEILHKRRSSKTSYIPFWSGMWMTMFRTEELLAAADLAVANGCRLTDGVIGRFGRLLFRKGWGITREHIGIDLTRALPSEDDYQSVKDANRRHFAAHSPEGADLALYNHDLIADGAIYDGRSWSRFASPPMNLPALKQSRTSWDEDPVVRAIATGKTSFETVYVSWKPPRIDFPAGLYLWLREPEEAEPPNSLASFGPDKAIVHLGDQEVAPGMRNFVGEVHLLEFFHPKGADYRARALRAAAEVVSRDGAIYIRVPGGDADMAAPVLRELEPVFLSLGLRTPKPASPAAPGKRPLMYETGLAG